MKKTETTSIGQSLGFPVLLGFGLTLLLMAIGSFAVLSGKATADRIPVLALICVALGSLCASFISARRAPSSRLIWGVAAGAILFACLMVLSIIWLGEPISISRVLTNLAVSLIAAGVGGMLGAGVKQKRRRKK